MIPWLGTIGGLSTILDNQGIDSVLIAASAVPPAELNQLTRDLLVRGTHVHLSSGLARFVRTVSARSRSVTSRSST